ncbi:hypothetical protein Pcinc_017090 [Petrolisthes cinctipes]|uniref:Uncharacterized protein n=1 Tax=Petrolisthes cinctipes TaxID=88211 RepID=A0AAE1FRG2_PETCI|nr:hypothetical protein Pcinc_017090 [Petrolisthes cinctipes]
MNPKLDVAVVVVGILRAWEEENQGKERWVGGVNPEKNKTEWGRRRHNEQEWDRNRKSIEIEVRGKELVELRDWILVNDQPAASPPLSSQPPASQSLHDRSHHPTTHHQTNNPGRLANNSASTRITTEQPGSRFPSTHHDNV